MNKNLLKNLLTFLFCLWCLIIYGQERLTDVIRESGDTLHESTKVISNNRICEIWYSRKSKKFSALTTEERFTRGITTTYAEDTLLNQDQSWQRRIAPSNFNIDTLSNEQRFMRGIRNTKIQYPITNLFHFIDSVALYSYNKEGQLIERKLFKTKKDIINNSGFRYSDQEFKITTEYTRIEGKTNRTFPLKLTVENKSPQNFLISWQLPNTKVQQQQQQQQQQQVPLPNRSAKEITIDITVKQGISNISLQVENSNRKTQTLTFHTIGYDILYSDFAEKGEQPAGKVISINSNKEIYIEARNSKLLQIQKANGMLRIPMSKIVNTIRLDQLKTGRYTLELINLRTNETRYCQINLQ